jgi:hypothetical protein
VSALAVALCSASAGLAQVPANQLMKPPDAAQKFVVVSTAGQHGTSALWKSSDDSVLSRESILLRGMVWEQDEAIHFGPNGQPDRITIRGFTPSGDAAETFIVDDREARWKTPVDSGARAYGNRGHYYPYGGTMSAIAVLAEKLYAAQAASSPYYPPEKRAWKGSQACRLARVRAAGQFGSMRSTVCPSTPSLSGLTMPGSSSPLSPPVFRLSPRVTIPAFKSFWPLRIMLSHRGPPPSRNASARFRLPRSPSPT